MARIIGCGQQPAGCGRRGDRAGSVRDPGPNGQFGRCVDAVMGVIGKRSAVARGRSSPEPATFYRSCSRCPPAATSKHLEQVREEQLNLGQPWRTHEASPHNRTSCGRQATAGATAPPHTSRWPTPKPRNVLVTITSQPPSSASPASSPPPERPVLSVSEVADLLGVSQWLVLQLVGRRAIPHKRVGRRILFPRGLVLTWLDTADSEPSRRPELPLRLTAGPRR